MSFDFVESRGIRASMAGEIAIGAHWVVDIIGSYFQKLKSYI